MTALLAHRYNAGMATLTIRNLPDATHQALRERAARHGRSMEEEVRQIIDAAVGPPSADADIAARVAKAQALVREMFGGELPRGRVDAFIAERRAAAERGE